MNLQFELQQRVEEALKMMSQAELARRLQAQIGYGSEATIINIKRGNWDLISAEAMNKLRAFFRLDGWQIRNTHNFVVITKLCDDSRTNKRMMAVAGYTGAGKTTALRKYATDNADTYYVLCTVVHSKRSLLDSIQRSMGIERGAAIGEMMNAIVDKLNAGNNSLLILDDAGKLSHTCLRLLQVIYDQTEFSAGIVLAGTEFLKEEIDRNCRRNVMGFRELKRRIAYWQPLRRPTAAIIAAICKDFNITDPAAVDFIFKNAKDYGTIRNLVLNAGAIATRDNVAVTVELLSDVHVGEMAYETEKAA